MLRTGKHFTQELGVHTADIEELLDDMDEQWAEGYETHLESEFHDVGERLIDIKNRIIKILG